MKNANIIAMCDRLWQQCICLEGKCRLCCAGLIPIFGHHNIPRASMFYRHDVRNGTPLCPHCHIADRWAPHASPRNYAAWLEIWYPEQYDWWQANKNIYHKDPDRSELQATRARLRAFLSQGKPWNWATDAKITEGAN